MRRRVPQADLATRLTVQELVSIYNDGCESLRRCFAELNELEQHIGNRVGSHSRFSFQDRHGGSLSFDDCESTINRFRVEMWGVIVDQLEIRQFLSSAKAKELDDRFRICPDSFPEITEANIQVFAQDFRSRLFDIHEEAVKEVFEFLRPVRSKLKTNTEYEVGEKVILERWLQIPECYMSTHRVSYYRSSQLTALEKVFRAMDGKGMRILGFASELENEIQSTSLGGNGECQTQYFHAKCFKNGNLHLRFKRMDLVAKLNKIAGGKRLK